MGVTATARPPRARSPWTRLSGAEDALAALALGVVVLVAAAVSLVWVFLVPIYQAPDEPQHLDYALSIAHHGGLIRPDTTPILTIPEELHVDEATRYVWLSSGSGMLVFQHFRPRNYLVHPATHHLIAATRTGTVTFSPGVRMPREYGTRAFYRAVDAGAPARDAIRLALPPSLVSLYPFGYYALLAAWIELLRAMKDSLLFIFFGARALSVLLLACSLVCMYGTLRELAFTRRFSLLLVAIIGLFPLTSFVSSYVQPDNLALALVSLSLYLALRARREPGSGRVLGALGVTLAMLSVTKIHFYLAVAIPILAMLLGGLSRVTRESQSWARAAMFVLAPSVLFYAVHLWSVWAVQNRYAVGATYRSDLATYVLRAGTRAILDYYSGLTHATFWRLFGWLDTRLVIVDDGPSRAIGTVLQVATWIVLALTVLRLGQVTGRLLAVAGRGRGRAAFRVAVSNPVINSYLLFSVLMVILYIHQGGRFVPQGRNWLPFILPIFLTSIVYTPRVLPRWLRRPWSMVLVAGLGLYSLLGAYYAPQSVADRYYGQPAAATLQMILGNLVGHLGD